MFSDYILINLGMIWKRFRSTLITYLGCSARRRKYANPNREIKSNSTSLTSPRTIDAAILPRSPSGLRGFNPWITKPGSHRDNTSVQRWQRSYRSILEHLLLQLRWPGHN